jgi:isoquinoline 1-oxidoreductase beta subunit
MVDEIDLSRQIISCHPSNLPLPDHVGLLGTSIARFGRITATNGVINQSNFDDYPVARIDEAPRQTNVYLVDSTAPPAGVGEAGVSVIPPALCNVIFAAAGKRIREVPLSTGRISS